MTRLASFARMKELMTLHYLEAKTTQEKPVIWVTSGAPVEYVVASGALPVYPENYAAMCAAGHQALSLLEAAEGQGFSPDLCSYARTDFGQDLLRGGPAGGLPPPRALVCATNICRTVVKWFEAVARKYRVPLFVVDMPFLHEGPTRDAVDYVLRQFEALAGFLADLTGRAIERERLLATVALSRETTALWRKTLDLCRNRPAPITALDAFVHIAPIVTLRGTPACRDYYEALFHEVEGRVARGEAAVPNERYRALWDNLPVWDRLRWFESFFSARGLAVAAATYPNSWAGADPESGAQSDDAIEALAVSYLSLYIHSGFEQRVATLVRLIEEFSLTGFIMHSNRSCKPYSVGMYGLREEVSRRTGVPGVVIEADQNDPRQFTEARTVTALEAFIESMEPPAV